MSVCLQFAFVVFEPARLIERQSPAPGSSGLREESVRRYPNSTYSLLLIFYNSFVGVEGIVSATSVDDVLVLVPNSGMSLMCAMAGKLGSHNGNLSLQQKTFNYRLSRACIVSENAFGRLKARWHRLAKKNDMDVADVPNVVAA